MEVQVTASINSVPTCVTHVNVNITQRCEPARSEKNGLESISCGEKRAKVIYGGISRGGVVYYIMEV